MAVAYVMQRGMRSEAFGRSKEKPETSSLAYLAASASAAAAYAASNEPLAGTSE